MEKKFDLSSLRLDETGRVEIDADQLQRLQSLEGTQVSGAGIFWDDGLNAAFCGGETNGSCTNWLICDNSTNNRSCQNYWCEESKNTEKCTQEGCMPPE